MSKRSSDASLWVASGFKSLGFLIFVLLVFMGYRYFEILSVFSEILPPETRYKEQASWLIAFCLTTTTMVFLVHAEQFEKASAVKRSLFILSLVINLMFWKAYVWSGWIMMIQRSFISVTIASMDYGFAHLFDMLQKQSGKLVDVKKLELTYNKLKEAVNKELTKLNEARTEKKELEAELKKYYCEKCERQFFNQQGKNSHTCKPSK